MNAIVKNLGVILVLIGFICLVVYKFSMPENYLLVCALALQFVGILCYIFINRKA